MSTAPLASPDYPRGIAKVGYSLALPTDYYVDYRHGSYGAYLDGYGLIEDGYDCEAAAIERCQEHHEVEQAERAEAKEAADEAASEYEDAAYKAELRKLFDVVNAQGGYVAPDDIAGRAGNRAINDVLAFIQQKAA